MNAELLDRSRSAVVLIDVQERLFPYIHEHQRVLAKTDLLLTAAKLLGVPILLTEQNPRGLGPTIGEIRQVIPEVQPLAKMDFSCFPAPGFREGLASLQRDQVLLAGIESHVCVYQTAADLLELGYEVQVVTDAISSRTIENINIGLEKMRGMGASMTSTETALFELLKIAEGEKFKAIQNIIK